MNREKKVENKQGDWAPVIIEDYYSSLISIVEDEILENLSDLERGFGRRKWAISKETGIPEDILTVLLKRLRLADKVEVINLFNEGTGLANGSGYCLKQKKVGK